MTIAADAGYVIVDNNPGSMPAGVTVSGKYQLAIPATLAEGNYTFDFNGTYLRKGGGGHGPPPTPQPWSVHAKLVVDKCAYENSGTDSNGTGTAKFIDKGNGGVTLLPFSVPIAGHTMGDVGKAAVVSGGGANEGGYTSFQHGDGSYPPPHPAGSQVPCPKCAEPIWHVVVMMTELDVTVKYGMTLPQWKQAGQAGPQAKAAWQAYYAALQAHEQRHVDIIKTYLSGDGQKVIDDVVKIEGWGEAHDFGRAVYLAQTALEAARKAKLAKNTDLDTKLKALQDAYDRKTAHGANQQAVGGTNIPLFNSFLECGE